MARRRILRPAPLLALFILQLFSLASGQLRHNFYFQSCPRAEGIIEDAVKGWLRTNIGLAASLLRLHFHDCFVQGCDGSVLLDNTSGPNEDSDAEKDADINSTLRGFDVVDDIKNQLENECPGTVSCADILAVAARVSVRQTGGPFIAMRTGRRDGFTSTDPSASSLPTFVGGVSALIDTFAAVGLSTIDMIALSGAHTIGRGHCENVQDRLPPNTDRLLDPLFRNQLTKMCFKKRRFQPNSVVPLDVATQNIFDSQYFTNLLQKKGTFITDSLLSVDGRTRAHVQKWSTNQLAFFSQFNKSLLAMSQIGVLTGDQGQVRINCRAVNN